MKKLVLTVIFPDPVSEEELRMRVQMAGGSLRQLGTYIFAHPEEYVDKVEEFEDAR